MYPVVFCHYTVVAVYCFSAVCSCFILCTVIVHCKTFVPLFIEFLVYLSLLFDKHTVVFMLRAHGGFFFTRSAVSPQMYITTVCVSSCLDGKIAVILSWGRSVFVSRLVGYWLELGGMGLFVANGVLVRHFVGVILNSSFRWLLLENYL